MKILVPIKRVVDYNIRVQVKPDGSGVQTEGVKHSINPFDEIAVEEAIRLKERGKASEVVVVTIGAAIAQDVLRHALALGADRAILVVTDKPIEPLYAAKILKEIVGRETPDLILMGKQAIDDDCSQTGQMLAALLGVGQATFASKISFPHERESPHPDPLPKGEGVVHVTREVDGGMQTLELTLPCVVTVDLRLNEPRYATLPNIMKAKNKPLATLQETELGVAHQPMLKQIKVEEPKKRSRGVLVADAAELVSKLKQEARVI